MEKKTSHGPKQNGPKAKQAGPNGYLKKKTRGLSLNSSGTMTLKSPTQIGSTNLPLKLRLIFSSPISSLTMTAQYPKTPVGVSMVVLCLSFIEKIINSNG